MPKPPFKAGSVARRDLPSYERKGCVAQEVASRDLVFVTFGQSKTEVQYGSGLPVVGMSKEVYAGEPGPGIRDTTVVGFPSGNQAIVLVDAVSIDGRSMRSKPWVDRIEALRLLCGGFSDTGALAYRVARTWSSGILRAYDDVLSSGGAGLLVRIKGKVQTVMCLEEDAETE